MKKFIATRIVRDIEGEVLLKIEDAYFPPIVDNNPEINAVSIPINEQKMAYEAIKNSFEALKKGRSTHKFLEESMLSNEKTFLWYCVFFKELEKQIVGKGDNADTYIIPYELVPNNKTQTYLYFQYPIYVGEVNSKYIAHYRKYKNSTFEGDLINRHRAELISQRLEYNEFRDGFPNWYRFSHVVFEKYSSKINKRVKLQYSANGEFTYYICGASDNWEQIYNVPLEIDDVIACILFRD